MSVRDELVEREAQQIVSSIAIYSMNCGKRGNLLADAVEIMTANAIEVLGGRKLWFDEDGIPLTKTESLMIAMKVMQDILLLTRQQRK